MIWPSATPNQNSVAISQKNPQNITELTAWIWLEAYKNLNPARFASLKYIKIKEFGWECLKMLYFLMKEQFGVMKLDNIQLQRILFYYHWKEVGNGKPTGLLKSTHNSMTRRAGLSPTISEDHTTRPRDSCTWSEEESGWGSQPLEKLMRRDCSRWVLAALRRAQRIR